MAIMIRLTRSFLCLLLVVAAVFAGRIMATAAAEAPAHFSVVRGDGFGGAVGGCWKSVISTTRPCARDVLQTVATGTLHMSKECCVVLVKAGEKCVDEIFNTPPLDAAFLPAVRVICGLASLIPS
ncbi:hypothetical protein BRADI_3g39276v3 [Brachypodium distachyon]|uniref:Prolamin-like domain-containing protein n=1 Tax=Brachypodium distachyon TaxID=15368 RepID=A0A0Q3M2P9_BRADI|nr:hypothetical protein BRADI_3g39276v3 [Brachypodium distachyon]